MNSKLKNAVSLAYFKGPPLAVSLTIAELYFKLGTFIYEALAFLSLWYVLHVLYSKLLALASRWFRGLPAPKESES